MNTPRRPLALAVLALVVLAASASPAAAADYADGFVEYWTKAFKKTDNVILLALGIGGLCIAVIVMGGRWKK